MVLWPEESSLGRHEKKLAVNQYTVTISRCNDDFDALKT